MSEPVNNPPSFICPFCGGATPDQPRCAQCAGPLDPLSRQATQNAMGPWFIRDEQHPFRPGCSYETILNLVSRGKVTPDTILRGPSTSQFWYPAKRVPGVAHALGLCHSCQSAVTRESECPRCGAVFHADPDRQFLGLMPVRALPGSPVPEQTKAAEAPPRAPARLASANALVPAAQPAPLQSTVRRDLLQAENASLRRRSGILLGIASGCGLVALGAIWVLASRLASEPSGAPAMAASPGALPRSVQPPAQTALQAPVTQAASPADTKTAETNASPAQPTEIAPSPSEPSPATPDGSMADEPKPESPLPRSETAGPSDRSKGLAPGEKAPPMSTELAALRAVRWP